MKSSIKTTARIGGILYLVLIFIGMFSVLFVRDRLIVSRDVTATANNIIAAQFLWRTGIVADLIMHVLDIPIMLIMYVLLKPVNKNVALLALLFNLVQTAVLVSNKLHLVAALLPLESLDYLKTVPAYQLQVQAYLLIKLHDIGFATGLIFFGFTCLVNGYLIFVSGFLPKIIGAFMQIAGLCYLANSFILLLAPKFSNILIMMPCFVAELTFCLWLIAKGVKVTRWIEKSTASQNYYDVTPKAI
ncbi:MAG TPA: DUF4386 domain-containing protein [Segetibacter sp.]|nr:DUF4386 domain-containing protein [Segetibacter sp.]